MARTVFLDMDGVLCDFVGSALRLHGIELKRRHVEWDIANQIGFRDNHEAFYAPMGLDFWSSLDWTAEGKELLKVCEEMFGDNIALMTSPIRTHGCIDGKIEWVKRHMPAYEDKILIDDNDSNVDKFVSHGGNALLVPRSWNKFREHTDEHGNFCVTTFAKRLDELANRMSLPDAEIVGDVR